MSSEPAMTARQRVIATIEHHEPDHLAVADEFGIRLGHEHVSVRRQVIEKLLPHLNSGKTANVLTELEQRYPAAAP